MTHELKILPKYFQAIWDGEKTFGTAMILAIPMNKPIKSTAPAAMAIFFESPARAAIPLSKGAEETTSMAFPKAFP